MSVLAGVDGCPAGWICIRKDLDSGALASQIYVVASDLFDHQPAPDVIAIDIPIGLSESQPRFCDVAARQVLSPHRHTSVFPAPLRAALHARTFDQACRLTEKYGGRRISMQAWGIYPKIRDVDAALRARPAIRTRVHEIHPEVSFWAWNRAQAMEFAKHTVQGRDERLALVSAKFGDDVFATVRARYSKALAGDDDILDAFAALWTAERIASGRARKLPSDPPLDEAGFPMEIVY